ncbi:SRPBCC family protein [Glycomyces sp. NPDC049804]|uniref:SRPBCC family protein n=1 Tax=Glycomyces sp. NPDC049804 TaxID=3154363 RepID=UPI003430B584
MAEEKGSDRGAATGLLGDEMRNLVSAIGDRALAGVTHKIDAATDRLTDYAAHGGPGLISAFTGSHKGSAHEKSQKGAKRSSPPKRSNHSGPSKGSKHSGPGVLAKTAALAGKGLNAIGHPVQTLKDALTGHGDDGEAASEGASETKVTNIVEEIDIGAPVRLCYDQWTQFTEFPTFMKKVENVEQQSDEKLDWKAQVFWSHRTWHSTIIEQVPDQRIVWRSTGDKGHVDGAVTFHELTPGMTRVILVLEYHPQGLMERTGNIWRAQGRRARLELKHFARHVMTQSVLHPDELQGWRGEIHDGQVQAEEEPTETDEEEPETDEEEPQASAEEEAPG